MLQIEEDDDAENLNVYTELCYVTFKTRESPSVPIVPVDKRDFSICELIETEKNYIDALNMIKNNFIVPLSKYLSEDEKKCIFFGIEKLHEIHSGFHCDLIRACSYTNGLKLHMVFTNWKEKFLLYGDLCSNLPVAQRTIETVAAKSKQVAEVLENCQREASRGAFQLKDLLTVPMQRVLKYPLLLKKLCEYTPETHDEYLGVCNAHEAMLDVADYINEVKRDNEMLQIITDVQTSISDWRGMENINLRDYGRLIKDGELKMRSHEDGSRQKLRYVFIFNRGVIFCKTTRGEQYSFRSCLPLENFKLEDPITTNRALERREARWTHQWLLVDNQNQTAYTLYAKTIEAKNKWIRAFKQAMEELHPVENNNTDHSYVMTSFSKPINCDICKKLLKGIFFQGYKCIRCNLSAHKDCLGVLKGCGVPLPPPRPNPVHVAHVPIESFRPQTPPSALNTESLERHAWFAGEMSRDTAEAVLRNTQPGTFLLRSRVRDSSRSCDPGYALSLKTGDEIKHMKVVQSYDSLYGGRSFQYFLSEAYSFRSVVELVHHYESNSLREAFRGLDAVLEIPWKYKFHTAKVMADYGSADNNLLPIFKDQHIVVVSKEGDATGWWKGRFGDQEGYFPKEYVKEDNFYRG